MSSLYFKEAHRRTKDLRQRGYNFDYSAQFAIELKNFYKENKMKIEKNISHSFYRYSMEHDKSEYILTSIKNWNNKRIYVNIKGSKGFGSNFHINLEDKEIYVNSYMKNRCLRRAVNEAVKVVKSHMDTIINCYS